MNRMVAFVILLSILSMNAAVAGIEFIPQKNQLYVKAAGRIVILKDSETNAKQCALKLEDDNNKVYILVGGFSEELQRREDEIVQIEGLLRTRIEFGKKLIPSIELKKIEKSSD